MKLTKRKKFIIYLIAALAALAGLYFLIERIAFYAEPSVSIYVAPVDSVVEIDGAEYKNGEYHLGAGKKHVIVRHDGFESKEFDIEVKSFNASRVDTYLVPSDGNFSAYAKNEADFRVLDSLEVEDDAAREFLQKYRQKMTITDVLPIVKRYEDGSFYRLYVSESDVDCFEFFCLEIDTNSDSLDSLKTYLGELGYNLDDYSYKRNIVEE